MVINYVESSEMRFFTHLTTTVKKKLATKTTPMESFYGQVTRLASASAKASWLKLASVGGGGGGVFLLEVQYSILKSLISTCVLSYVGSREDWLLDRICESKKDCWDSIRRTSYPYQ